VSRCWSDRKSRRRVDKANCFFVSRSQSKLLHLQEAITLLSVSSVIELSQLTVLMIERLDSLQLGFKVYFYYAERATIPARNYSIKSGRAPSTVEPFCSSNFPIDECLINQNEITSTRPGVCVQSMSRMENFFFDK
jgi:hypothetical protein